MIYIAAVLFSAFIAALDQYTKYLTVSRIPLGGSVPAVEGLFRFTYVRNTGMAFSLLQGGRWIFFVVTVAALVMMVAAVKKKWVKHAVGIMALSSIAGGAIGNLIDRVRLGFVIDMIEVTFMEFAVFNVADCFVVCGAILLVVYTFFFDESMKKERSHDSDRRSGR